MELYRNLIQLYQAGAELPGGLVRAHRSNSVIDCAGVNS